MRISDWSSDVCSSDLFGFGERHSCAPAACKIESLVDRDGGFGAVEARIRSGSGEILDLDIEHWIEPKACLAQSPAGRFDIGAGCGKNRRTGLGFLKRLRESQDRGKGSGADRRWNRWCWGASHGPAVHLRGSGRG